MKGPIFVYGEGYLDVFSTKEKAESWIESIDVKNGVYTAAYDSESYQLKINAKTNNNVLIDLTDPPIQKINELRELLLTLLKSGKSGKNISNDWLEVASLNDLVLRALEYKTW